MKLIRRFLNISLVGCMLLSTSTGAHAVDYSFSTESASDYYSSTSYEDAYGSQYNYGGLNVVDYQIPELEYGSFSTTLTGVMERAQLPGLQETAATTSTGGGYGVGTGTPVIADIPGINEFPTCPQPAYTSTDGMKRSDGSIGTLKIPSGDQHEGVGGRNKFQYAKRSGPLLVYFGLGRQCWRLWAQPRNQVCDRLH